MKKLLFLCYVLTPAVVSCMQENSVVDQAAGSSIAPAAQRSATAQLPALPQMSDAHQQAFENAHIAAHNVAKVLRAQATTSLLVCLGSLAIGISGSVFARFNYGTSLLRMAGLTALLFISGIIVGAITSDAWYSTPTTAANHSARQASSLLQNHTRQYRELLNDHCRRHHITTDSVRPEVKRQLQANRNAIFGRCTQNDAHDQVFLTAWNNTIRPPAQQNQIH